MLYHQPCTKQHFTVNFATDCTSAILNVMRLKMAGRPYIWINTKWKRRQMYSWHYLIQKDNLASGWESGRFLIWWKRERKKRLNLSVSSKHVISFIVRFAFTFALRCVLLCVCVSLIIHFLSFVLFNVPFYGSELLVYWMCRICFELLQKHCRPSYTMPCNLNKQRIFNRRVACRTKWICFSLLILLWYNQIYHSINLRYS